MLSRAVADARRMKVKGARVAEDPHPRRGSGCEKVASIFLVGKKGRERERFFVLRLLSRFQFKSLGVTIPQGAMPQGAHSTANCSSGIGLG